MSSYRAKGLKEFENSQAGLGAAVGYASQITSVSILFVRELQITSLSPGDTEYFSCLNCTLSC